MVRREFELLSNAAPGAAARALGEWRGLYEARRAYLLALPDGPTLVRADVVYSYVEGWLATSRTCS